MADTFRFLAIIPPSREITMIKIIYSDTEYRSLREACGALNISYLKVKRLCRHYVRAHRDPTLAIEWMLGDHIPKSEPKTSTYYHDQKLTNERKRNLRARAAAAVANSILQVIKRK